MRMVACPWCVPFSRCTMVSLNALVDVRGGAVWKFGGNRGILQCEAPFVCRGKRGNRS